MRFFKTLSVALVLVFPSVIGAEPPDAERRVPILGYHYVKERAAGPTAAGSSVVVTPAQFDEQMYFLREHGYTSVSLFDLWLASEGKLDLPPKPVVITFDDCCERRHLEGSVPILQKYGFTATYFVVVDWVGKSDLYAGWEEVAALAEAGMELGSHTMRHLNPVGVPRSVVHEEIVGSQVLLAKKTGAPVRFLSYPFGITTPAVLEAQRAAGYLGGVGIHPSYRPGLDFSFPLPRYLVSGRDGLERLEAELLRIDRGAPPR